VVESGGKTRVKWWKHWWKVPESGGNSRSQKSGGNKVAEIGGIQQNPLEFTGYSYTGFHQFPLVSTNFY
jgi:hypothetical protein